jgi:Tol biopolymer transport system component
MKAAISLELKAGLLAGLLAVGAAAGFGAPAGGIQLVAAIAPAGGAPATGGGDSVNPIITPDGRYVLFASTANNLVVNGTNGPLAAHFPPRLNVFLRDRTNGTTTLVSVDFLGLGGGNGDSTPRGISTNGQFALFESTASNLVANDTNNAADVFVRDVVHGTTTLVSVSANGGCANGLSRDSVMTPDGRYVAFSSLAGNLVAGDTNGIADIFVRDLQQGTTTLASPGAIAIPGNIGSCDSPEITPDGRYVVFTSTATNLAPGIPATPWIYERDMIDLTTVAAGTNLGTAAPPYNHRVSDDGQYVVFETNASTTAATGAIFRYNFASGVFDTVTTNALSLVEGYSDCRSLEMTHDGRFVAYTAITNGNPAVFVWDAVAGTTTLASANTNGTNSSRALVDWPAIDESGRYVSFLSTATDLVTNAVAGNFHLYVRDLTAGTTQLADVDTNGAGSPGDLLSVPRMTPDGRCVVFDSTCPSLVPGDNNKSYDVFARDLTAGTTELISARQASLPSLTPNGTAVSGLYGVSSNGQYVAFASVPGTLVSGTNAGYRNVFVCDVLNGTNSLVSVDTNGLANGDGWSWDPAMSGDGRFIVFTSGADNLVAGDTNGASDVFLRDLQAGTTTILSSKGASPSTGNYAAYSPSISQDGRYVLFHKGTNTLEYLLWRDTQATTNTIVISATHNNMAAAMTPDGRYVAYASGNGVVVWDSQSGTTTTANASQPVVAFAINSNATRIVGATPSSVMALFLPANTNLTLGTAPFTLYQANLVYQFSADGRYVAYTASYIGTPFYSVNQACLYDFLLNSNLVISTAYNGSGGPSGNCDWVAISPDGRYVAYRSVATNLVPGYLNGTADLLLYDQTTALTSLVNVNWFGSASGNAETLCPVFSGDGQTLFFQSWASDLVARDFSAGGKIFALNLPSLYTTPAPPPLNVAFGGNFSAQSISGQGAVITWPAAVGNTYQVQYKNDLNDSAWQILNASVTIEGNQAYVRDASGPGPQRFYRIVSN